MVRHGDQPVLPLIPAANLPIYKEMWPAAAAPRSPAGVETSMNGEPRPRAILGWIVLLLLVFHAPAVRADTDTQDAKALKKLSLEELFDLEVTSVSQRPESLSKVA